ncbi:MAG TPA: DinB family protein [Gemmataceae bacterium]|nr:DinB family protein [Gemmataceae bacterium]
MHRPEPTEFDPYYAKYINLVPETDLVAALESQLTDMLGVLRSIPEAEANVRHAPYTWSIKEVVGHLADTERVMGYRALRFARADTTPLPGFDENAYATIAAFDRLRLTDLVAELEAVRRSHIWLFRNLPPEAWTRAGEANGKSITVRALAFILVGHGRHHTAIIRKRLAGVV